MDILTLIVSIVLMMIAFQFGQNWIVLGIVALVIFTSRSLSISLLTVIAAFALYIVNNSNIDIFWPAVLLILVIIALVLGLRPKEESPDYYAPGLEGGGLEGLMGGGY